MGETWLAFSRASIYTLAAQSHIMSAGFGIILIGIVALSVLFLVGQ